MGKIPIHLTQGKLARRDFVVGIDLGTTNSLIAIVDSDTRQSRVLPGLEGHLSTPSLVYIHPDGMAEVGASVRRYFSTNPQALIYSVKRLMGVSWAEYQASPDRFQCTYPIRKAAGSEGVEIELGPNGFSPEAISAEILKVLKQNAERALQAPVLRAVITVPAYFNDGQRKATREAGRLAGFDVLRIINEPTAASLAYGIGLQRSGSTRVAVYDLGGGTFDISVLEITDGVFEVLSTHGDTHLGGDDFDQCIVKHWIATAGLPAGFATEHQSALRVLAEQAKCALSQLPVFTGNIDEFQFGISRAEFESLIHPLVIRTLDACQRALIDAGCGIQQIDEVVLVGGSTRVPAVINQVSAFFNRSVRHNLDPDQVVALGAAIQADILAGNNQATLLLDVTPLSLGIETAGGLMDVLIPRNSKIPAQVARQYTTQKDGQTGIRISVFQGERDMVSDNRELATFHLSGIPGMPAGLPKIQVAFLIDADGILQVRAKELRSGIEQSILINDKIGLTDEAVESMVKDAVLHAEEDISKRKLTELKVGAEQLVALTQAFIKKNYGKLQEVELLVINQSLGDLLDGLSGDNVLMIQHHMDTLNAVTRPFAERVMDEAISAALTGQEISKLSSE